MTKKKIVKKKVNPAPSKEVLHIRTLIEYTQRSITNDDTPVDLWFKNQLNRLNKMLEN